MAMNNLDPFPDYDVPQYREKGKHGWKSRLSVDNQEWNMVYLQTVGQVMHSCPAPVGVSDHDHLMSSIDELGCELIDMTLYPPWLRVEEVTHHCDAVPRRHAGVRPNDFPRLDCIFQSASPQLFLCNNLEHEGNASKSSHALPHYAFLALSVDPLRIGLN